jgi:hypothetical protein
VDQPQPSFMPTLHPIENAILVVAVEIFQSITAPGNQIMSDNFQPIAIYS